MKFYNDISIGDELLYDEQGRAVGSYRSVGSIVELYSIPEHLRKVGMRVYVTATSTNYTLSSNPSTATTATTDWAEEPFQGSAQDAIDILDNNLPNIL